MKNKKKGKREVKTQKFVRDIIKNPTLVLSALGTVAGSVLLNLFQQFDIACKNNINFGYSFVINRDSLPQLLGMKQKWLGEALYDLERLDFVYIEELPTETPLGWANIYLKNIREFFKEYEQKQKTLMQDELLKYNTAEHVDYLNNSTVTLREFVQKHSDKIIPVSAYLVCDDLILYYEAETQHSFTKIPHVWDYVLDILKAPEFEPNQLIQRINNIVVSRLNQ